MKPIARTRQKVDGSVELAVTGKMAQLLRGELSVKDMDMEELARGQFRDRNGGFTGRPPAAIPTEVFQAMRRELLRRGDRMFGEAFESSIAALVKIATDEDAASADRIKAAQYVIERIAGKTPDKVEITTDAPWMVVLQKIVVGDTDDSTRDG